MSLGVKINENVYIAKTAMDDKGTLEIQFKANTPESKMNILDALQSEDAIDVVGNTISVKLFPPLAPFEKDNKGNPLTTDKRIQNVQRDLLKTQQVLIHLLQAYTTKEYYGRIGKESFNGLDITNENYEEQLVKKEVLTEIHKNRCRVFVEEITPFLNNEKLLFRLLLVRQSKDKHFATFRTNYVEDNPFYESMDIPAADTKVKFTPGEIKDGLNDGTPSSRDTDADKNKDKGAGGTGGATSGGSAMSAANIFG
jgi:hypothetical protein